MAEYVPPGRASAFTLPDGTDPADLIAIFQDVVDDCVNIHGDTITGDFTITGTVDISDPQKAGVDLATIANVGILKVCTSSTHPGSPAAGQLIFETDTLAVLVWDGAAWSPVSGASTGGGWSDAFLLMGA